MSQPAILEAKSLSKEFGGVIAVHDVSFTIARGEIFAIIGPNGAGKTTLFNLVSGVYAPTRGELHLNGRALGASRPHQRAAWGLARTFQNLQMFNNMTVLENVMVGRHTKSRAQLWESALRVPWARREEKEIRARARQELHAVGLESRANSLVSDLPFGQQRLVELARAMATDPQMLLLDEPGAGLTRKEIDELDNLIRRLRDQGVTVLLVEHDMELVMGIADRVMVLDYGIKIAEGTPLQVQQNERVIAAYLGVEAFTAQVAEANHAPTE